MLDLRYVADNLDAVSENLKKRGNALDLGEAAKLSQERRRTIGETEALKAQKNTVSSEIARLKREKLDALSLIEEMKAVADKIKVLDARLAEIEEQLAEIMYSIPNLLDASVPFGKDSDDNPEVRRSPIAPREFSFLPEAHWDIGERLKILSPSEGAKITGARFTVYRGFGARLERALINFMLDTHTQNGYTEVFPPFMVNRDSMYGTGQLPKFEEDMFAISGTDYFLVPTAEVPVTNLHRGDILNEADLTIKYCAYTACFRAEAGSAGRDTRGLIRQHQFNKVELVKFARPEDSLAELESLTRDAEGILEALKLPYRVVTLCSGDVGFSSAKTYDLEVYMPSYQRYVEISSCSTFTDFQARRANIRYRDSSGKVKLLHTLNGSGLAVGRTVAAILENYQNADGTVSVPEVLQKYMGTDTIR
ncbi:MAG: serine--tRNA ligase [Clostridia bacterium]